MKIENNIGWCDETGNKVTGCDKVSSGCKNCYAQVGTRARVLRAQGIETWGPQGQRYPVKDFASKVRRLNKLCVCDLCHESAPFIHLGAIHGKLKANGCNGMLRRIRIFADSNSDWLDDKWPIKTLADLLKDIHDCPNVDFQLLTKRPENFLPRIRAVWKCVAGIPGWSWLSAWESGTAPPNCWIGVSVEDQKRADERIPLLLQIPARVRFLSVEPLLEPINLKRCPGCGHIFMRGHDCEIDPCDNAISWVIGGLESGKDRRDAGVESIIDLAGQCVAAGVPFYCKQDCALKPGQKGRIPDDVWSLKQFPNL